ncbi:putative lipoprotein [Leptospira broomii serovar Hurstbridge str. 5399]|uniref:Lipoprotein n=1 Tax=Leptospira broomii serovar Hurstbridge str. 5399 TaxID=1049789 RepID=T0GAJ0_9LEPT|nr:hypothetical protein [Leptospira broomii]EQA43849.1 putative lipoprotein [Leptospira broomii serovar Hurstbridge str. 5399]
MNSSRFFLSFNRILILSILFAFLSSCNSKTPSDSKIISQVLSGGEEKHPKVVLKKVGNLDDDPELESFAIVRNGTEEILAIFKKDKDEWRLIFKLPFSLLNIGPMHYESKGSSWKPGEDEKAKEPGYIIKRILMEELPGDEFNSLFLEILSEEPPIGLFSVPFVIRKGAKVLDGLASLKDHEFLVKSKRADFTYNKEEKNITVFPGNRTYAQNFNFNGWEMVPDIANVAAPGLLSVEAPTEWKKGESGEVVVWFKNRGSYAGTTYISLSFPQAGKLEIDSGKEGVRMYSIGSNIYSAEGKYINAKVPLLEITKEGWGRNHRYGVRFKYTPDSDGVPYVLFRSTSKAYRETVQIPTQASSVKTELDQQGYRSYPLSLITRGKSK